MQRMILGGFLMLTLAACSSITPGGAGLPQRAPLRALPVTSGEVLSALPQDFQRQTQDRQWGRPVTLYGNAQQHTLVLTGRPGPASDSLTVVAFRTFGTSGDDTAGTLDLGRSLLRRIVPDPAAMAWFDEWAVTCCTDMVSDSRTFGPVVVTLSHDPALVGTGFTFYIEGDELRH